MQIKRRLKSKVIYFCSMKCKITSLLVITVVILLSCHTDKDTGIDKKTKENNAILQHLNKEIANNRDSAGLRLLLVNVLDSLGNYKEAASQLDSLIGKDSLNYGLWYRKGRLLETSGDTMNAIQSFAKAIKIYPSPDGQLSLANLLAELKNEKALQLCQQVQDLRMGRDYSAHCNFIAGVYYARTGHKDKALKLFDACIIDNFGYMEAYQEKGFLYYDDKQFNEALKIFQMAANINNTYADAYYWQAKCYEALGNKEAAIKNYEVSIALDKSLKEADAALKRLK